MRPRNFGILLIAAASCVFAIGVHAGGRDGLTSFGDFDPGELPRLLDPGFNQLSRSVATESKERKRTVKTRAVRCFELKRTFRIEFWNACAASKSVDADCGDVAACQASGDFGAIQDRKAVLCDRQRVVVPIAKWKACVKLKETQGAQSQGVCGKVFDCEKGARSRFP